MSEKRKRFVWLMGWILLASCMLFSCTKTYSGLDPLSSSITHLTGNNGAYSKWLLQSMYINQLIQPVGSNNLTYFKSYQLNGSYSDADGLKGTWKMITKDSLQEVITNAPGTSKAIQGYRIEKLSDTGLTLTYTTSSGKIILNFVAGK